MLNANALTNLATLKSFLGIAITDASKDLILELYINGISDYIQGIDKTILATDYAEKYQGTETQNLILKHWPINSITTLTNNESDVTDYEILKNQGILYRDNGWGMNGSSLPMMHDRINQVHKSISISYNAGYTNVPSDLLLAILEVIKSKYDNEYGGNGNLKSYSISDVKMEWKDNVKEISVFNQTVINKYRGINI